MDTIVAIHVTKLLTKDFSLSARSVRYFLGQYVRPFKLYQFLMKQINKFAATEARKPVFEFG